MVAYRSRQRWIQTFEKMRLEEPAALPPLREGGVYLITGGLGGIGLVLAHDLARTVNAKLVLLARSAFPERAKWSDWLAGHDESDSVSAKIRQLQEIESAGGQVMVISADVADLEKMQSALEAVHERFGDLHGVIHAAGVAGGGVIQFKSRDLAVAVMTPKIRGTLVLDALLKNTQLDFFLLCSSLASILGGPGQVDYCAGNTFLDAYANAATSGNAQHVVSLNWDRWQETGMAVNTHVPADMQRRRAESLEYGLLSQEGVQAFRRALGSARPQIAISTLDLQSLLQASVAAPKQPGRSEPVDRHTSQHPRPPLTTAYAKAQKGVEQTIVGIWQELFGIMPIGIYDDFFELGGHSLLAIQLSSRLSEAFALDLPVRAIFDAPTAAQLARVIEQARGEAYEDGDEDDRILDLVEDESDD
jgi:NAD(P)-dependent dehydrogenase (short-subunit alcohol dehydrogenase family)